MLSASEDTGDMADTEPSPSKPIAILGKARSPQAATSSTRTAYKTNKKSNMPAHQQMPPMLPQQNQKQMELHRIRQEQSRRPPLKLSDPVAWPTPEVTRNMSPKAKVTSNAGRGNRASDKKSSTQLFGAESGSTASGSDDGLKSNGLGGMVGLRHGSVDTIQTQDCLVPDSLSIDIMSVSSVISNDIQSLSDSDADSSEAYPDGTMTRCSTPSQEGRETVVTESSSLPDNISLSLLTQEPRSADALDNEFGGSEPSSMERRLDQRQKQLDYGKNTAGYERYARLVPKNKRKRGDPQTPDKYASYSKRAWDGLVRVWRRKLHAWDPPGLPVAASHIAKLQRQSEQSAIAARLAEEHNRLHGLEEGEIPQGPTFASIVSSGGLSFHRKLAFPGSAPAMSSVEGIEGIPVVTVVEAMSRSDSQEELHEAMANQLLMSRSASEEELEAMTNQLKNMLIPSAGATEQEEETVQSFVESQLPPLPANVMSATVETVVDEDEVIILETGVVVGSVEEGSTLAFVPDHSETPCALVANLENRAVSIVRALSPPLRSPMSVRSFNWADDADADVDWEVTDLLPAEESSAAPAPLAFDDKDCVEGRELEEGEILE